jgi:hypothetical protein
MARLRLTLCLRAIVHWSQNSCVFNDSACKAKVRGVVRRRPSVVVVRSSSSVRRRPCVVISSSSSVRRRRPSSPSACPVDSHMKHYSTSLT